MKVNALPLCVRECEDGRVFSHINDRKLMSVFGRDQGATFYTCLKIQEICQDWFSTFVNSFSYFFPWENGLDFRKGNRIEGVNNCLYLP